MEKEHLEPEGEMKVDDVGGMRLVGVRGDLDGGRELIVVGRELEVQIRGQRFR